MRDIEEPQVGIVRCSGKALLVVRHVWRVDHGALDSGSRAAERPIIVKIPPAEPAALPRHRREPLAVHERRRAEQVAKVMPQRRRRAEPRVFGHTIDPIVGGF